jgi:hypothetical protein
MRVPSQVVRVETLCQADGGTHQIIKVDQEGARVLLQMAHAQ